MAKQTKQNGVQPAQQPTQQPQKPVNQASPVNTQSDVDWSEEAGGGFEMARQDDYGIPFLVILQKGSPEVDPDHKDYATKRIQGAQSGMIMNTLTRKIVFDGQGDPMQFIPCSYVKLYQEWRQREQGGGFIQSHRNATILTECKRNDKNQDILPNGNMIITTSYFQGLYMDLDEVEWKQAIIAMNSTQLKKARSWLNMASSIRNGGVIPPLYSQVYQITTATEHNAKGSWRGWVIELCRALDFGDNDVIVEARSISRNAVEQQKALDYTPSEASEEVM
jgi:hypothetical protein